jgi:hypothetical protein
VLGNSRLGKTELEHQFSHIALGPQGEQIHNLPPAGFGDGVENIGGRCRPSHGTSIFRHGNISSEKIDGFETISSRFEPLRPFGSALSRLSSQAEQPRELIEARVINTLAGGALAMAAYAVWPTRAPLS